MVTWPATLPKPKSKGYAIAPLDQVARSQMETGADRTRRRTHARNDRISVSWLMSDAQLYVFRQWFEDDVDGAAGGAAWFSVRLAAGGVTRTEQVDAKFVGTYSVSSAGNRWAVSGTLEVR